MNRPTRRLVTALTGTALLLTLLTAAACPGDPLAPLTPPTLATAPQDITVTSGAPATFSVIATGAGLFTFQWTRDGADIAGATTSTYTVPAAQPTDSGAVFRVVVSTAGGSITSAGAILTVLTPPVIVQRPLDLTIPTGVGATIAAFSVGATGSEPLAYQWQRDGVDIAGATAPDLRAAVSGTTADDGALFRVVVSNAAGSVTSSNATLRVLVPPAITADPLSLTVVSGSPATFTVTATGSALLHYQWSRNGTDIPGATSPSYTLPATTPADSGVRFRVTVGNLVGAAASSLAALTVLDPPVFVQVPFDLTIATGSTLATFRAGATGSGPLAYQWTRDGVDIPGATSGDLLVPLSGTKSDDGAVFRLRATNAAGTATSFPATLRILDPPVITAEPLSLTVVVGSPATFTVGVTGDPPLLYEWSRGFTTIPNATSASYTLPAATMADSGATFSVWVHNFNTNLPTAHSTKATLTVIASPVIPPVISSHPVSTTVAVGGGATFQVTATGTAPLSYQWQRNGSDLVGQTTASYTLSGAAPADDGALFRVIVSNAAGRDTSTGATLTVLVPPLITVQPLSLSVASGSNAGFMVSATGSAPLSYQWQRNGVDIGGATAPSYTLVSAAATDNGVTFRAVVTNLAGSDTSNSAALTVTAPPLVTSAMVAAGGSHSLGLKSDGTVWAWGSDASGQLGNDLPMSASPSPVQVSGLSGIVRIAAGQDHSLALRNDGTVWAWGQGSFSQLGNGGTANSATPVQVTGLTNVVGIAAGGRYSLAIKSDGTVWTWGSNSNGQLGDGSNSANSTPLRVSLVYTTVCDPVFPTSCTTPAVRAFAAGWIHSLVDLSDLTANGWGDNFRGEIGDAAGTGGSTTAVPIQALQGLHVTQLAGGYQYSLALLANGTILQWGQAIGIGGSTTIPTAPNGLSGITQLAAGYQHALALKSDGTVWGWGGNNVGQLTGNSSSYSGPNQVGFNSGTMLNGAMQIGAGELHTLVLKQDGTVWAFGDDRNCQLGRGCQGTTFSRDPVQVVGLKLF